jgi:protocatechuate 3,4-dioxygenase beta subunit
MRFHPMALLIALAVLTACTTPARSEPTAAAAVAQPTRSPATADNASLTVTVKRETAAAACDGSATPAATEGPYYKQGSPLRAVLLEPGMSGTKLTITGNVYAVDCTPVANAWLDFWQADSQGVYDNSGYTLRGHLNTDASGKYTLVTLVPGRYPGRTPHIHVKVQAPGGRILTTQLYLPDQPSNATDSIFDVATVMKNVQSGGDGVSATFDFVVAR